MRDHERIRDNVLDEAVRQGKIAAANREEHRRLYDSDPVSIRRLLTATVNEGGLMPGLVGPGEDPLTAAPGGYDASWLSPIERGRIAQATAPAPVLPQRSQPRQASPASSPAASPGGAGEGEGYPTEMLTPGERERITAAREGRYVHDRVQVEEQ